MIITRKSIAIAKRELKEARKVERAIRASQRAVREIEYREEQRKKFLSWVRAATRGRPEKIARRVPPSIMADRAGLKTIFAAEGYSYHYRNGWAYAELNEVRLAKIRARICEPTA
jgi:hypothetical protein